MKGIRIASLVLLALTILAGSAFGQILTGTISGTVTDSSEAIVPNAAVTIVSADTGVTVWRGVTNDSGVYRAPALPVGRYKVSVEKEGFKRADASGITVALDQRVAVNVTLQTGTVAETVNVVGDTAGQL